MNNDLMNKTEILRILILNSLPKTSLGLTSLLDRHGIISQEVSDIKDLPQDLENFSALVLSCENKNQDFLDLIRLLRQKTRLPLIVLANPYSSTDCVLALEFGADEYVAWPGNARELIARLRSRIRHTKNSLLNDSLLLAGPISIHYSSHSVKKEGTPIELTPLQYSLLVLFCSNPNHVFTRNELIQKINGYGYEGYDRTIDTHVKNLRKVLEKNPAKPEILKTVWGIGYKLVLPQ